MATSASAITHKKPSAADFMFGTTLGEGAYARVVHARLKKTGEEFAVKIMEKRFIKKENKVKFVMMERTVFARVSHERIVKLFFTFQDRNYLYMVMELCRGGELLDLITSMHQEQKKKGIEEAACSLEITKFYMAQVIQALEYLHSNRVIHRDLKPENILLTEQGNLKLTDFGTAKDEAEDGNRANTFCGTAEYVSPEVLRDMDTSRECDLWAVGCMVFQMLVGRPIFRAENEYLTFQQIMNHDPDTYIYPETVPKVAQDLCTKLLVQNPKQRLGSGPNGYAELKAHPFFDGIDWEQLSHQQPPYVPPVGRLPPTDSDGATDDWLFAGVATELQTNTKSPKEVLTQWQSMHAVEVEERKIAPQQRVNSRWNQFLMDDESITFTSPISKRRGLFSKKRQMILTSRPRLIYIDPVRMKQKGEIPWSKSMYIQLKSSSSFDIVTPNRIYHISDSTNGAQKWADVITEAVSTSYH